VFSVYANLQSVPGAGLQMAKIQFNLAVVQLDTKKDFMELG